MQFLNIFVIFIRCIAILFCIYISIFARVKVIYAMTRDFVDFEQDIGLPPVWKATPTAKTCRQFRCRVATHWAAPTKMFVRGMIFPPRKGHHLLNGNSIISLGTTIVAFPALLCKYFHSI